MTRKGRIITDYRCMALPVVIWARLLTSIERLDTAVSNRTHFLPPRISFRPSANVDVDRVQSSRLPTAAGFGTMSGQGPL
jgi:hypothetical protein